MDLRKILIISGATLLVVFAVLGTMHHNRDRQSTFLERLDPNTYISSDFASIVRMKSAVEPPQAVTDFFFEKAGTYECLNGKNPSKMDAKEQLLEFIQGPCLPAIAIPGVLATKLTVNIDCETLQSQSPDIFAKCGWSTCSSWEIWHSKPKEQYTLWISDFLGPLSVVFDSSVRCWANLIHLNYNASETDIKKKYLSPVGVNISVFGSSQDGEQARCGFEAITDILPSHYQTFYTKGYKAIEDGLVKMGYQTGLSLYAVPYDWRKTTLANGITEALKQTLVQIHELTGKPAIIMAHSLGNFGALHLLNSLTEEEKEKYVANYVSITNPLAGSPKTLKTFIGGDQDYIYKKYGINYYAQSRLVSGSSGAFDLVPKNVYDFYANSSWLKDWKLRSDLENNNDVRTKEGRAAWEEAVKTNNFTYRWFPTPLLNCSYGFEQRRDECGLYMYNWSAQPIAIIQNESFTASETELKKLFNDYALSTNVSDHLFNDVRTNDIWELLNPGVPTTLIYGSHLSTDMTYKWDYDPRESTRNDDFAFANETLYSQGDQTVPTSSALLPALKWSWEFDHPEEAQVKNPKPIKTVEICSIYNNKGTIYDKQREDGTYEVTENEYIGLPCDCFGTNASHPVLGQNCNHGDILVDSKLVAFVLKIVNANYTITNTTGLIVNNLTIADLKTISTHCPSTMLNYDVFHDVVRSKKPETIEL